MVFNEMKENGIKYMKEMKSNEFLFIAIDLNYRNLRNHPLQIHPLQRTLGTQEREMVQN